MQTILLVRGLSKSYEGFCLQDVDLTLEGGTILGLIGENGAGKTTTIRAVLNLVDVDRGEVEVFGMRYRHHEKAIKERLCVVLDDSFLSGELTARDVGLIVKSVYRSWDEPCFFRMLQSLQLPPDKRIKRYSSGMKAKLKVAAALPHRPDLLVLDEPMAALDVTARAQMRALVARRTAEQGLTVLVVTHDILDVTALADDVIVLQEGRVAEYGSAAEVLTAPTSDFAARLTGTSVLTGTLEGDPASPALRLENGALVTGRPGEDWGRAAAGGPGLALVPPDAVALYPASEDGAVPHGSPRNTLTVTVTDLERSGALVTVSLRTEADQCLTAAVTAGAVAELGIKAERRLEAVVKAVQVRVLPAHSHQPNRQC